MKALILFLGAVVSLGGAAPAFAESDEDLAKQLSNPVADLISVPLQFNYDGNIGSGKGDRVTLNVQPVIPFSLNSEWNLITRTIMPVTWQSDIAGQSGTQFGLGDTVQSFFLSPRDPTGSGITWGAGPVFLYPTATDDLTGLGKWGAGPTAAVLELNGPWTVGILANHIWSFAGRSDRPDVNATFAQPFVTYTTANAWSFGLNTETTYDWRSNSWAVPLNATVGKLVVVEGQPINFQVGLRYWAESPAGGARGFGARFVMNFVFPQ
ncbi:transporter [Martelella sp. HB161492]|uniref:transporter n=1 Tax=Martelella sp. HB161492 TaxID=2720726 RepID=UPI00158FA9B5|nr:transporter [Martelella sp. HB161492]